MSAPEISICTPVYKGVRFLAAAVESVCGQTFPDWELILVDDGSKDGSGPLADHLAGTDARIRVIHQPNGGTSVARNAALAAARGRYLAFLDEDDLYHPQMLETLHSAAEKTGADISGCDRLVFNDGDVPEFDAPPGETAWRVADPDGLREWLKNFYFGVPFEVWLNLYRRDRFAGHLFTPGVRVEQDMLWHYTLLPRCRRYVRIPWNGYAWRSNGANGSLLPSPESLVSLLESYAKVIDVVDGQIGLSAEQRAGFVRTLLDFYKHNVFTPLRRGLSLSSLQSKILRERVHALSGRGVDIRPVLGLRKRLCWTLFLLTGQTGFIA